MLFDPIHSDLTTILGGMHSRIEMVCRGWLNALPFVLSGPVAFWLLFAPAQMQVWSWSGLIDVYEYGIPLVTFSVIAHLLFFFLAGMPVFLVFWARKSVIWWFPASILFGVVLAALFGFLISFAREDFDPKILMVEMGYGAFTALGCWLANRMAVAKRSRRYL